MTVSHDVLFTHLVHTNINKLSSVCLSDTICSSGSANGVSLGAGLCLTEVQLAVGVIFDAVYVILGGTEFV